jgi:predicted Zn-dependent peptidase
VFGDSRRQVVEDDVPLPRILLAFRIAPFGSPEWYPASVCASVLGLRRGCRLYRGLVRNRPIASETNAFTYDLSAGSDLLVVDVTARPGVMSETLEREVTNEIDTLVKDGVAQDEVDRALAQIETDYVVAMQSAQERADRLSLFATYFGDPARINGEPGRYRAVDASAVTQFARTRLKPDNRAMLLYVPRESA